MDPIVAQVIEKLKQRNAQSAEITYSKSNDVPSTGIFVDNANLVLKQVSIELIADLFHLDQSNRWVTWILQGLDYDVNFQLNVSYHALVGRKLMIVRAIDSQGQPVRPEEVAVDSVGAGIGEYVLLVRGAGARIANHADKNFRDVSDCAIVGIIDSFDK